MLKSELKKLYKKLFPTLFKSRTFKPISSFQWKDVGKQNIETEFLILPLLLKEDSIFFDVGANVGQYLYTAEKHIPPKNIYGFEPNLALFRDLQTLFPGTNLFNIALSKQPGTASFKIPLSNKQKLHTRGTLRTEFIDTQEDDFDLIEVRLDTLDTVCVAQNVVKLDLVKIDVEGHELDVIEGGRGTLQKFEPLMIIEIEGRHHEKPIPEVIQHIATDLYKCYYFDLKTMQFVAVSDSVSLEQIQDQRIHGKSKFYINNFLFVPKKIGPENYINEINEKITHLVTSH